jgi:hypothetical protein
MIKHNLGKLLFPSLLLFVSITLIFMIGDRFWNKIGVSHRVVIVSNILLYGVSALTAWMNFNAIKNPNPNVFSRSIMAGTLIKLMIFGIGMVIYLLLSGSNRSVPAIFVSMALYIVYSILDVKAALLLNKKD